jgi:hypothetical protein
MSIEIFDDEPQKLEEPLVETKDPDIWQNLNFV